MNKILALHTNKCFNWINKRKGDWMLELTKEEAEEMLAKKSEHFPEVMKFEYNEEIVDFVIYTPVLYPDATPEIYFFYAEAVKLVDLENIVKSDLEDDEWMSIENYKVKWDFFEEFTDEDGAYIGYEEESSVCDWDNPYYVEKI